MFTQILPSDHLLLENNLQVRQFRKDGAAEVLVVFGTFGEIVALLPPSAVSRDHEFRDPVPLFDLVKAAYLNGLADASVGNDDPMDTSKMRAPKGWILWRDLPPGTLAYDGHDQHIVRFPKPFSHTVPVGGTIGLGMPRPTKEVLVDTAWLPSERTIESVRSFAEVKDPEDLYLKVLRTELTQAQCIEIREMCKRGDYAVFSPSYIL